MISINIDYIKTVNYALFINGVTVCRNFEIENTANQDTLKNVIITCSGDFIEETHSSVIAEISGQSCIRIKDFEIKLAANKLASLTEKTASYFTITIHTDCITEEKSKEVFCKSYPIEVMTYDYWLGTCEMPQSLVSFVTPNHPAISKIVISAAKHLKALFGFSAFYEYQTQKPQDVIKQVAAVYYALHEEGIVYRSMPPNYEEVGQRITLPVQVLQNKIANCIELSILFASVLESIGINCTIIINKNHAFLGIWLVDDCCEYGVCDDVSYIEKKISKGIEEMMVLECTSITAERALFEEASRSAESTLANHDQFIMFLDVKRCRLERYLPLPLIASENGTWKIDSSKGVDHDECIINIQEHSRYDLNKTIKDSEKLTRFDIWERKLLDFSLRNSLLNLYLKQRAIQCISFDVDKIEDYLQGGEEFCILPKPQIEFKIPQDERLVRSKLLEPLRPLISEDIKHNKLHTYQTETESNNILKNIYRSGRIALEETGSNPIYLAIGTLRWYESNKSEKARYAPLLMLPINITNKKGGYYIKTREEDITLNVTLVELLRQNYDIEINGLSKLPKDEHGVDVSLIFAIFRDAIKDQKRWDIEEECIIGVFSFNKFVMWNDIHSHREEILKNNIVKSLVDLQLSWKPSAIISNLREEDKDKSPNELALPIPVDSSQMAAVYEAGKGHSFVLYGPPGTGKSQTITNLISNALFHGKRVLFVAEKMAALSVVQKRLEDIGLKPFCLELHSNKVAKRHVLEQLDKALKVKHIVSPITYPIMADNLYKKRLELISHIESLHAKDATDGFSIYDCIIHYEAYENEEFQGFEKDEILFSQFTVNTLPDFEYILSDKLKVIINLIGQPSKHPLLGLHINDSNLLNENTIIKEFDEVTRVIKDCQKDYNTLSKAKELFAILLQNNQMSILNEDGKSLYNEWRLIKSKWILPKLFAESAFMKRMRIHNPYLIKDDIDILIDNLISYQQAHHRIEVFENKAGKFFILDLNRDELPSCEKMEEMVTTIYRWKSNIAKIHDWFHWCQYTEELKKKGLTQVTKAFEKNEISPQGFSNTFMKSIFHEMFRNKIKASSTFRSFEGMMFDEQINVYKKLAEEFQELSAKELYSRLASAIPMVTDNIKNSSEIGYLNRNISNGGRGVSIRDLFDKIPNLLPRLCPCMLMSPMSVAQFLEPDKDLFDIVIFDEASQMPTNEAIGAIARGKALVVVGDPKQMPPTSFFNTTNVDEDEADIDDMESILEDCRTLGLPCLQLNWHYRSRHESLIAFSNSEYYDGKLVTFPSVDDQTPKVKFEYINGVYDKGGKRVNRKEAEAVVDEVVRRLLDENRREQSIGIIAFSVVQQNLIEDMLQDKMIQNRKLLSIAESQYEPIFIKNLENVQGDERDVILFSIGYGPDKDGNVSMNFGPLNNIGGERRLNVAVSRSRQEMIVFSSMKASQIDLRRSKSKGVKGLHDFLEFAEHQKLPLISSMATENHDAIISRQIAKAIEKEGYIAKINVGRSNFKVNVAISSYDNPNIYSLGILLDGEEYNNIQTTRDREIVQPSILNGLNWNIMRVWTIDWINNPQRVVERIIKQLKSKHSINTNIQTKKINLESEAEFVQISSGIPYDKFTNEDHRISSDDLVGMVKSIVTKEYPILLMQLCKRVCTLKGLPRVIPSLVDAISELSDLFYIEKDRESIVFWPDKTTSESYSSYRIDGGREIEMIPITEVKNAAMEAIREQFSIDKNDLTLIVAKKLGFTRRGVNIESAINDVVNSMIAKNTINNERGKLTIAIQQTTGGNVKLVSSPLKAVKKNLIEEQKSNPNNQQLELMSVDKVNYINYSRKFFSCKCQVVLANNGYFLKINNKFYKLGAYPSEFNWHIRNIWIKSPRKGEHDTIIVHENNGSSFTVGLIQEGQNSILFKNADGQTFVIPISK